MSGTWHFHRYVIPCKTMSGTWHWHRYVIPCKTIFGIWIWHLTMCMRILEYPLVFQVVQWVIQRLCQRGDKV
ncbi:hypothetical protein F383_16872 [Gossypium arboreum]|uniref:Uncharacterized protein n=1 Tax=Gossypium arboreum TaxID=29729 RepID=A0A0B0NBI5_GOSAR|nr:hypothetical protein F383_16872 [Gossypium arboreum]